MAKSPKKPKASASMAAKTKVSAADAKALAAKKAAAKERAAQASKTRTAKRKAERAVTDEERGFLAAMRADLDSDAPRLIFADWLEERGDAIRSEFIRVQCALARMTPDDPARADLEDRESSLLARHERKWMAALPRPVVIRYGKSFMWGEAGDAFERGFLANADLNSVSDLQKAQILFTDTLVHRIMINGRASYDDPARTGPGNTGRDLARMSCLAGLSALHLSSVAQADGVLGSPHLPQLRTLGIATCGLQGFDERLPVPPRLARLELAGNALQASGIRALLRWPGLAQLRAINLSMTGLTTEVLREFSQALACARLEELVLAQNPLDLVPNMGPGSCLGKVRDLNLSWCRETLDGLPTDWSGLTSLESLILDCNELGPADIARLAETAPATLRSLSLLGNRIGDEGAEALARSTRLGQLTHLVISRNDIGERGLLAIAESPGLQRLRTISIDDNPGNSVRTRQALKARFQLESSG